MGIKFIRMKKIFLLLFSAFLVAQHVVAQFSSEVVVMPDSTKMTVEELLLSEDAMSIYLHNLPTDSLASIKKMFASGIEESINQVNQLKGTSIYDNILFFDGEEYDEGNAELIFSIIFSEKINGESIMLFELISDTEIKEIVKQLGLVFWGNFPPGIKTLLKWCDFKFALRFEGKNTKQVVKYFLSVNEL